MNNDYSLSQIMGWLNNFYRDKNVDALRELYSEGSFPEILSVGRKELCHSSFLGWLFDMNASHKLKEYPFLQLLKLLIKRGCQQGVSNVLTDNVSYVFNESVEFFAMDVKREIASKGGRTDLEICCDAKFGNTTKKLLVVIENKVYAKEHDDQTVNYYNEYSRSGSDDMVFVFLTPRSSDDLNYLNAPSCKCKQFVEINYQDLLDVVLEPSLKKASTDRGKFVIKEYIRCLGMPISDVDTKKRRNKTIMATSKEVSEMLSEFWSKNESLINAAMATIAEDLNQEPELRDKVKDLLKVQSKVGKDKTHYNFNGSEYKGKNAILTGVLIFLVSKNMSPVRINADWEKFLKKQKGKLQDVIGTKGYEWTISCHLNEFTDKEIGKELTTLKNKGAKLLLSYDEYQELLKDNPEKKNVYQHDYSKIKVNDNQFSYYNQWGWKNIDYFLKFYRVCFKDKNYPEIKLM